MNFSSAYSIDICRKWRVEPENEIKEEIGKDGGDKGRPPWINHLNKKTSLVGCKEKI